VSTVYSCDDNLKTKRVLTLKLWRFVRDGVGNRTVCFLWLKGRCQLPPLTTEGIDDMFCRSSVVVVLVGCGQ
jgi:hypothetical protein